MTTSSQPQLIETDEPALGSFKHGLLTLAVVLVLSLATWYLFIDPKVALVDSYPQPFNALLFWAILALVWLGFTLEFTPFARLAQPHKGTVILIAALLISVAITLALGYGWGAIDPSFAHDRTDGLGYQTGALWVLFGFLTYVMSVVNFGHWPWAERTRQPHLGAAEIAALVVPTCILYGIFGLPSLATWAAPDEALMSTPTAIGVFYSLVTVVILTGSLLDNWPWRLAGRPAAVAAAAATGTLIAGIGFYFGLREVSSILIGRDNTVALGSGINQFPAQLGVCWVFWIVLWSNAFGNWPRFRPLAVQYLLRVLITFGLGVVTFVGYYFVFAHHVLHEPVVAGGISGDALGWIDLMIFWTLVYVLCFEFWGIGSARRRMRIGD